MTEQKTEFTINIAGSQIGLRVNDPISKQICADYLTGPDAEGSLIVEITEADVLREAQRSNARIGELSRTAGPYHESLAMFRKITEALIPHDTLLIHGSVVAVDGEAYMFSAPSGTGKSTHTALWRAQFGDRAMMVNDDKPMLRLEQDRVLACGTPWNGKHHLGNNVLVPLKGICYLERAEENSIERLSSEQALPYVFRQTYRPADGALMLRTMDLLSRLLQLVPVYRMHVNNFRPDAVSVAYEGMRGS